MRSRENKTRATNKPIGGTLLYVTEAVDDPNEALTIDSGLADINWDAACAAQRRRGLR